MRKLNFIKLNRVRYQEKRRTKKYKKKRINRLKNRKITFPQNSAWSKVEPTKVPAPEKLSLINHPNELVNYLKTIRKLAKFGQPILVDIAHVTIMTYETIPVLISFIKNKKYFYDGQIHGNAPEKECLKKIFTESGFYDFVNSKSKFKSTTENLLHQESNFKVKPEIAGRVTDLIEFALESNISEDEIEAIYNIFIELMSNTHHHADITKYGHTKWWLFAHCAKDEINITFVDQGIGIFKSRVVKEKIKKLGLDIKILTNLILVDDLLDGKIQSRINIDNEIRGKGLPQIVEYSKFDIFESFYIITNDIWINLKNRDRKKLTNSFNGTLINFTIKK